MKQRVCIWFNAGELVPWRMGGSDQSATRLYISEWPPSYLQANQN